MGLKDCVVVVVNFCNPWIKSDHSGIERRGKAECLSQLFSPIKSDHSGIESWSDRVKKLHGWDVIKSDHSGIESGGGGELRHR